MRVIKNETNNPAKPEWSPKKLSQLLKGAIIHAANEVGYDGEGTDGLPGYCKRLALSEPRAFASLLAKALSIKDDDSDQDFWPNFDIG